MPGEHQPGAVGDRCAAPGRRGRRTRGRRAGSRRPPGGPARWGSGSWRRAGPGAAPPGRRAWSATTGSGSRRSRPARGLRAAPRRPRPGGHATSPRPPGAAAAGGACRVPEHHRGARPRRRRAPPRPSPRGRAPPHGGARPDGARRTGSARRRPAAACPAGQDRKPGRSSSGKPGVAAPAGAPRPGHARQHPGLGRVDLLRVAAEQHRDLLDQHVVHKIGEIRAVLGPGLQRPPVQHDACSCRHSASVHTAPPAPAGPAARCRRRLRRLPSSARRPGRHADLRHVVHGHVQLGEFGRHRARCPRSASITSASNRSARLRAAAARGTERSAQATAVPVAAASAARPAAGGRRRAGCRPRSAGRGRTVTGSRFTRASIGVAAAAEVSPRGSRPPKITTPACLPGVGRPCGYVPREP